MMSRRRGLIGWCYWLLRTRNDINAARRGKLPQRVARRLYGKATGRLAGRIFR